MKSLEYFKGCLIGGAVGDALGASIEFMSLEQIRSLFGSEGLTDYAEAYGGIGSITDDTQMTLFTAEGLILSRVRQEYQDDTGIILAVYHALLRWLYTQETGRQKHLINTYGTCSIIDGVLTGHKELFSFRAPGNSCLSALQSGELGTIDNPVNNSKGCGGVMRMAPVGLMYDDPEKAFRIGCECAALTHGHPTGYLASGTFASILSRLISGETLTTAINDSISILKCHKNNEETLSAIDTALELADKKKPDPDILAEIGEGWTAGEALGLGIYCSLVSGNDFKKGVLLAVNHSGDSDSTGSITGNILGAINGIHAVPESWIQRLELRSLIEETAVDLFDQK
ncbi:ADP-ribosylglycohydrolase family protein [uncultured Desulfobacter sp.]|uniref:ADP-ribosylglycohydrolase family protein n=1 Tax=uncultured Desulfobacter sp. TaxID=240139 RepID=UPI002AAB7647|nr:ADP-ribosylglycohydrolase family protein [uncultured Desulfobacter sp.]